jgi:thioredoxin 1
MATITLSKDNFEQVVNDNDLVLIDFWASWCGPCQSFAPIYETISEKVSDVIFGKVNTEEERELAATFQVRSIPTLMIFREQIIIFSQPGAIPGNALEDLIQQAKALDMDRVRAEITQQQA